MAVTVTPSLTHHTGDHSLTQNISRNCSLGNKSGAKDFAIGRTTSMNPPHKVKKVNTEVTFFITFQDYPVSAEC